MMRLPSLCCRPSSRSVTSWQCYARRYNPTGQLTAGSSSTATRQAASTPGPRSIVGGRHQSLDDIWPGEKGSSRSRRPNDIIKLKDGLLHVGSRYQLAKSEEQSPEDRREVKLTPLYPPWLRDHCACEECVHPLTKQRLIDTFHDIPSDITTQSITEDAEGFQVVWDDGHESYYRKDWLRGTHIWHRSRNRDGYAPRILWDGLHDTTKHPPKVDYNEVMSSDAALLQWLHYIRTYGFCYVENTPVNPDDTKRLLERIAYIRVTHYGGFWDFTSDLSKGDTAYTNLGIGPHTDNTYFSDPAGLQLFHLLSHTDGSGGVTQLVDGFHAADQLCQLPEGKAAYRILATTPIETHASGNEDSSIQPWQAFPTLVEDPLTEALVQVRWNTTDRAAVCCPADKLEQWYRAARLWSKILHENQYIAQLEPGTALIFDNWRILHGRSAFTGKRRMCGGYINRDDFVSRYKVLKDGKEEVLRQVTAM